MYDYYKKKAIEVGYSAYNVPDGINLAVLSTLQHNGTFTSCICCIVTKSSVPMKIATQAAKHTT